MLTVQANAPPRPQRLAPVPQETMMTSRTVVVVAGGQFGDCVLSVEVPVPPVLASAGEIPATIADSANKNPMTRRPELLLKLRRTAALQFASFMHFMSSSRLS